MIGKYNLASIILGQDTNLWHATEGTKAFLWTFRSTSRTECAKNHERASILLSKDVFRLLGRDDVSGKVATASFRKWFDYSA